MIGSIIFVKTSSPISWFIRKLTKSEWSHVAISCSEDNTVIIESDVFKRLGASKNKYQDYVSVDLELTDEQKLHLIEFLLKKNGRKYDYKYILGFGLKLLGLVSNENRFNTPNRFMCSEIVDIAYSKIGINLIPDRKNGDCTPADLASALLKE